MPQWLSLLIGIGAGLAIVLTALFVAVRPHLDPKRTKSWMPDASDNEDRSQMPGIGPQ
jgi:hypothetical protein